MLLEVEDLQAGYAQVPVVKGIRLSLREGEIAGIVGESGCGKSTFLRSLMVLDGRQNILGGSIRFAGTDLLSLSEEELRRIRGKDMVMIFQNAARASDPLKTIGHQFYETMRSHCGKVSKKECWQKAEAVLQQLHFPDPHRVLKSYSFELSGGMNQRAAIALALLLGPRLMLADEPTSALDVTAQAQVIKQMQALRETTRTAILLVTHNIGVVAQLCDQVGVMYAGRLVEWGTVRRCWSPPRIPIPRRCSVPSRTCRGNRKGSRVRRRILPRKSPGVRSLPAALWPARLAGPCCRRRAWFHKGIGHCVRMGREGEYDAAGSGRAGKILYQGSGAIFCGGWSELHHC